jgi:hypothetical protein
MIDFHRLRRSLHNLSTPIHKAPTDYLSIDDFTRLAHTLYLLKSGADLEAGMTIL